MRLLPTIATALVLPFASTGCIEEKEDSKNTPAITKPAQDVKKEDAKSAPVVTKPAEDITKEDLKKVLVLINADRVKSNKGSLPELFKLHDFNGNGKIDVPEEALEFHSDRATHDHAVLYTCFNTPYEKTREEVKKVADWFINVGNSKGTSPEEKEVFLDVAARLYEYMKNRDSILTPLPRILAEFDEDKNGSIDVKEALKFYETRTKIKLERDNKGQVTPRDFRKVIDAFAAEKYEYLLKERGVGRVLNIPTSSARYICGDIICELQRQYSELYGPYDPLSAQKSTRLIDRD
ncbi:MAG: EF-hand domain-containing protein [Candidatus Melainabacteria bacterium]|nr:EF-hand domain-containing protein [Candidatus Melainabacteria bacterium]